MKAGQKCRSSELTETDGRQLAIDMMREIEARWADHSDLEHIEQPGDDDDDEEYCRQCTEIEINREPEILRRYLDTVRNSRSAKLERGFLCLVTELLASVHCGGPMSLDLYESDYIGVHHG